MCSHGLLLFTFFIFPFCLTHWLERTHLMLINESPESILIIRESTMETQGLLCFCQPLQEGVDHRVKFLCLTDTHKARYPVHLLAIFIELHTYTYPPTIRKVLNKLWTLPLLWRQWHVTVFYKYKERQNTSGRLIGRRGHHSCGLVLDEWQLALGFPAEIVLKQN